MCLHHFIMSLCPHLDGTRWFSLDPVHPTSLSKPPGSSPHPSFDVLDPCVPPSRLWTAHTSLSHSHATDRWLGCWRGHCTRQAFLEGSMVWAGAGLSGDCPPRDAHPLVTESPQGPGKVFLAGLVKTEQAPPARRKTRAQL